MSPYKACPPSGFTYNDDFESIKSHFSKFPLPNHAISTLVEVFNTSGKDEPGFSPTFRIKSAADGLINTIHPSFTTIYDYIQFGLKVHGENDALGNAVFDAQGKFANKYQFSSYNKICSERDQFGAGLIFLARKLNIEIRDLILTIFSANSYEWFIVDLVSHAFSIPNTSLYDTLGPDSSSYILSITRSSILMVSDDKVSSMLQLIKNNNINFIKLLILTGSNDISEESYELAKELGIELQKFSEVLSIGSQNPHDHILPKPDTLYTISFTSGTVGNPKGVCLTHGNAVAALASIYSSVALPQVDRLQSLCILPLAHVYQRIISIFELVSGVAICFPSTPKDTRTIMSDIKVVKPTHIIGVPRIFNRIDAGLKAKLAQKNFVIRFLINLALRYKQSQLVKYNVLITNHWLFDRLLINSIKSVLGLENLQLAVTGSAPILPDTIKYLRGILNTKLIQGYGLTESFACISIGLGNEENPTSSGYITVSTEFKLRDIPEMEYTFNLNQSGELLLRGPQIFESYYKAEEKTRECLDADGWFSTGDIAKLSDGKIIIIDRVKNFFKLSQGEYISPEKIENIYQLSNSHLIEQIFVYGDSLQSFLVGIVVPHKENAKKFLLEKNSDDPLSSLKAKKLLLQEFNNNIKASGLYGFEKLKNVHFFLEDDFNVNNDLLTPTLKIKRFNAKKFFEVETKELYEQGDITK